MTKQTSLLVHSFSIVGIPFAALTNINTKRLDVSSKENCSNEGHTDYSLKALGYKDSMVVTTTAKKEKGTSFSKS